MLDDGYRSYPWRARQADSLTARVPGFNATVWDFDYKDWDFVDFEVQKKTRAKSDSRV